MKNPLILRDALRYIALYRDSVFVLKFGGDVVARGDFAKLAQDIALMHSLGIKLVLVHGAAPQIESLAGLHDHSTEKVGGLRVTDDKMMHIVKEASAGVTMEIISTLSAFKHLEGVRLRPVMSNPVRARAKGHIDGVDFQRTGDITRIEAPHLKKMLDNDMIPVLGPLGIDSKGDMFNVNADTVALEVAATLKAEKLIFLTNVDGILDADGNRISAKSDGEMQVLLDEGKAFTGGMIPKVTACIEATTRGVRRVHVLNGLTDGVLLFEVFSTEGVGTMIYSGRYENIRPALESDVHQLMELIRIGVSQGRLKERTRHEVIDELRDFLVYEVDNRVVGCVHVPHYPEIKASEVACLQVDDRYKADGAGAGLLQYAERVAQDRSDEFIFALTTQTGAWFESQNYTEGSSKQLPPARRAQQEERGSTVFVKKLS